MEPSFKPSNGASDVIAPAYVVLAMDNNDHTQFSNVVVSYNADGQPLSYLTDDVWDFRAYTQAKSSARLRAAVWNWVTIPTTFRLTVQRLMYMTLFETRRTDTAGMSGIRSTFDSWSVIARLCQQCEIPSLSALGHPQMQRKLLDVLSAQGLSYRTVMGRLRALYQAHCYGFTYFPITNITQLAKKLAGPSKGDTQTLAIPQSLAAQIYSHAINRIEAWHEQRVEMASFFDEYVNLKEQQASKKKLKEFYDRTGFVTSESRMRHTATASALYNDILASCGAVIGAVSGMRNGEWYELDADSYQEQTFKGITHSLLVGKTSKFNNGRPIRHAWATAPVARLAIELLVAVSDISRKRLRKQANKLVQFGQPAAATKLAEQATSLFLALGITGKAIMVELSSLQNALNRLVASAPSKDGPVGAFLREEHLTEFKLLNRQWGSDIPLGKLWPITTHQFRRTFAVFLLRNGFGSFLQLKQQFAHLNISMSIWYGRNANMAARFDMEQDTEIQTELSNINALLMTDIAEKIYLSDEPISGGAGLKIRAQITQGNSMFESREEIEAAIRNGSLSIVDNGHSLCLNPSCERLDCTIEPIINPALCSYDVIMGQHAQQRIDLRTRLIHRHKNAVEQNLNQPNLLAKTLVGIRACEKIMADHGIEFEPYGALIDIKILGVA